MRSVVNRKRAGKALASSFFFDFSHFSRDPFRASPAVSAVTPPCGKSPQNGSPKDGWTTENVMGHLYLPDAGSLEAPWWPLGTPPGPLLGPAVDTVSSSPFFPPGTSPPGTSPPGLPPQGKLLAARGGRTKKFAAREKGQKGPGRWEKLDSGPGEPEKT